MGLGIGILHPGAMGVSVGATARNSGQEVFWVSEGRSSESRARAVEHGLQDASTLENLCRTCSVIISVCPPHGAEDVAEAILATGFSGTYADVNAISPMRSIALGERLSAAGITYVDGGIIGGPAWEPGTVLYLSGEGAAQVAAYFAAGPLETVVLDGEIGRASALKMCYSAWSKGTSALLTAILGAAEGLAVRQALEDQWTRDEPGFAERAKNRATRVTAKAWRFSAEMDEIASTFETVGIPGGFHRAAAEVYERLAEFKGRGEVPALDEVLEAVRSESASS